MPILTHCDLSSRTDINKLTAGSEKLKHSAFLCEIQLNAFARKDIWKTVGNTLF